MSGKDMDFVRVTVNNMVLLVRFKANQDDLPPRCVSRQCAERGLLL